MAKSKPNNSSESAKKGEAGSRLVVTGKPTLRREGETVIVSARSKSTGSMVGSAVVWSEPRPPSADFSDAAGARPPDGGNSLTELTVLTRLTGLNAVKIDIVDVVDGESRRANRQ